MRKKLKSAAGLTLVEMMCAVAILVLLVLMMNTALHMALDAYRKITSESETQLLISSITDALNDKLRYAVVEETRDATTGNVTGRRIFITEYSNIGIAGSGNGVTTVTVDVNNQITVDGKKLLPDGAYGIPVDSAYTGRYVVERVKSDTGTDLPLVTYDEPAVDGGTPGFKVKFAVKDTKLDISKTAEFTIRCLSPVKKEEVTGP